MNLCYTINREGERGEKAQLRRLTIPVPVFPARLCTAAPDSQSDKGRTVKQYVPYAR